MIHCEGILGIWQLDIGKKTNKINKHHVLNLEKIQSDIKDNNSSSKLNFSFFNKK